MNTDKDQEIEDLKLLVATYDIQLDRYEKALRELRNELNMLQSFYDVAIKERDYERKLNERILESKQALLLNERNNVE